LVYVDLVDTLEVTLTNVTQTEQNKLRNFLKTSAHGSFHLVRRKWAGTDNFWRQGNGVSIPSSDVYIFLFSAKRRKLGSPSDLLSNGYR